MTDAQPVNLTPEHRTIVAKLRYMARQYTNGSYARGGSPSGKHYLDEAADAIEELAQRAAVPVGEVKPVAEGFFTPDGRCVNASASIGYLRPSEKDASAGCTIRPLYTTPPAPIEGWRMVPVAEQISDGDFAASTHLMELADRIDHEQNWRLSGVNQRDKLTKDQQDRVLAGVMLRRYADLMAPDSWRLFPPKAVAGHSWRAGTLEAVVAMAKKYALRKVRAAVKAPQPGDKV